MPYVIATSIDRLTFHIDFFHSTLAIPLPTPYQPRAELNPDKLPASDLAGHLSRLLPGWKSPPWLKMCFDQPLPHSGATLMGMVMLLPPRYVALMSNLSFPRLLAYY